MTLTRKTSSVFLIITLTLLAGCVSTVHMTPQEAKKIHTVYVSRQVTTPALMSYQGAPAAWAAGIGGLVGGVTSAAINNNRAKLEGQFATANHIFIAQIVRDDMLQALKRNTHYQIVQNPNANATLSLTIRTYGLAIPIAFTNKLKPTLVLEGQLRDSSGKMLWQDSIGISAWKGNMPHYTLDQFSAHPSYLYNSWNTAGKYVAARLVQSMVTYQS